jgi:hypothetical protein
MSNEFDFNTAGEQRTFDVIPANTIVTLQMMINRGGVGPDGWLTQAADGASENLDCVFIVPDGQFAKRKLFQKFTLHGERPGHAEAGEISRNTLRAIIESARGIRPDDKSEVANAARKLKGYGDFDGLRFIARLGVRPPKDGYAAKNTLLEIITPERQNWTRPEQIQTNSTSSAPAAPPANAVARPQWAEGNQ